MSTPHSLMRDDAADSRDATLRIEDRVASMGIANEQPAPPQRGTSADRRPVDHLEVRHSDLDGITLARLLRTLEERDESVAKRVRLVLEQSEATTEDARTESMSSSSSSSSSSSTSAPHASTRAPHNFPSSAPTSVIASATSFIAPSSSSSSSSSASASSFAPTQPYADLATVQQELAEIKEELTQLKAEIRVVKERRDKLPEESPAWQRSDRDLQRLLDRERQFMDDKKLLMEKEARLLQDIMLLRERAEQAAAPQKKVLKDIGHYDPGPWPPAAPDAGDRPAAASASASAPASPAPASAVNLPDLFDTSMRRVVLLPTLLRSRLLPAMATELRKAQWQTTMGVDNQYHDAMNLFIGNFLELRQSKGSTEAMLHARDDSLFHIIKHSSGITLSLNRDAHSSSTAAGTRPDCHLAVRDWAPLVLVEEKANEGELVVAINELRTKFRWLPHYGNLPFVFAIAIAGDTIEFGRLDKSHAYMAFPGPGANGLARFCTAEEESLRGALNCIHAAINIGRCIRVMSTEFTMHLLHQPFNEVIHRHNKTLRITFEQVEKRYDPVRAVDRARMTAFYAETAGVECLEKGEVVDQPIRRGRAANDADDADDARNRSITFHLRPVGINALPLSSDTEGIRRCLKDLLTALSGVHALGWVVGDLRKPNVVLARAPRTTVKRYFVIDAAEYACRVGEELNEDKLDAAPHGWTGGGIATAQWDLRMLWDMVAAEKYDTRAIRSMPHGEEFCAWLSGRFARSGGEEKSAADLLAHPFLDGVVPEPF